MILVPLKSLLLHYKIYFVDEKHHSVKTRLVRMSPNSQFIGIEQHLHSNLMPLLQSPSFEDSFPFVQQSLMIKVQY